MNENISIYMVGVGGQGVLTIAELLLAAANARGIYCNYYPTKGMAQRGGFVKAQIRLGSSELGPEISRHGADVVIAMELSEALKAVDFLKPGGDMIVYGRRWLPTDVMLGKAFYPTAEDVAEEAHKVTENYRYIDPEAVNGDGNYSDNILLLAAAREHTAIGRMFSAEELSAAVAERFPKGAERNTASFEAGQKA